MAMQRLQVIVFCCLFAGLAQRAAAQQSGMIRVGFEQAEYTVREEEGFSVIMPVNVRIFDTGNDDVLEDPLFGSVSTLDGSARAVDMDYVSIIDGEGEFTAGSAVNSLQVIVNLTILDDLIIEGDETFFVTLSRGTQTTVDVTIDPSLATVTIIDNDFVTLGFSDLSFTRNEGVTFEACVEILLTTNNQPIGVPLTANVFTASNGATATAGLDYSTVLNPSTLTFSAQSIAGDTECFDVTLLTDTVVEGTESFFLSLTSTTMGITVTQSRATVNIVDLTVATFVLNMAAYAVNEDQGSLTVFAQLDNAVTIATDILVFVETDDDNTLRTAFAGVDYASTSMTFTFSAGNQGPMPLTINILNGVVPEVDKTFFVQLTIPAASSGLAQAGTPNLSPVTIMDDDAIIFDIALVDNSVPENVGNAVVIITPQGTVSEQVILTISSNSGSATGGGVDFNNLFATLTFAAGVTNAQTVSIGIIDDLIVEANEMFTVIASSTNDRVTFMGSPATVTIEDNDVLTIGLVPPVGGVGIPNYQIPENSGSIEICVEVESGSLAPGQTATVLFSTSDGSALQPADYMMTTMTLQFNVANIDNMLCVDVPIQNDQLCEGNEVFNVFLTENDPNAVLGQAFGTVTIMDDDTASVALNFVDPMSGGSVSECIEELCFDLDLATAVTKGPGRQCVITVQTADGSAVAGQDYTALSDTCVFTATTTSCQFCIGIEDNVEAELDEYFSILLSSNDLSACQIQDDNITATIVDDEDCDDDPCGDMEDCVELPCLNNFTCNAIPEAVGDDPHFAVTMANGKTLCYTVQGEHGFAFNLISNKKVYMNAMFVPDAYREEVTWLGTMGIVVNNNGYKKSNMTRLRFEAIKNRIHIDDQMVLEARNIEKITFQNGKLTISEAPPTEGYKQPFVRVDLKDVDLSFSIKFMTEHLDLYWHSTGQKVADSHGLIGQFFRDGVSLDNIRKLLILPGKEPVPIQRKPLWAFMERERGDSTNFCWVAMNPGYQGEGLIDGSYFDYLVDDVLSTEFKYKKL